MTADNTSPVLEVFADVGCPFAHASLRMIVDERQRRDGHGPTLMIRSWPLEVVNGAPIDAAMIAEEVDDIRAQVAPELFTGFDEHAFPATTVPAMELTARAYEIDLRTGEAVALACRDLLFEQGVDVDDGDVLAALADEHGVPHPEVPSDEHVRNDLADGRARGVVGSPHFFGVGDDWFCPALDIRRSGDRLRIDFDREGFEALMAEAFTD